MSTSTEDKNSSESQNPTNTGEVAEETSSKASESAETSDEAGSDSASDDEAAVAEDSDEEELAIEVEVAPDPLQLANEKIAELEVAKKSNYDRLLRASADLENVRKRTRKEVKDARLDERAKVLRDMLPVIDNLERASVHAKETESEATKSILEGVGLVIRQFEQALERHKVTRLDSVGKAFDPAVHEAVSQAPSADHDPGTVITALQTGYMMEERLLRPALVVVSTAMPVVVEPETDDSDAPESDEGATPEEPAKEPASGEESSENEESATESKE